MSGHTPGKLALIEGGSDAMNHPPRLTMPARTLTDPRKPARYVPAANTDIRETFKRFARLNRLQLRRAAP